MPTFYKPPMDLRPILRRSNSDRNEVEFADGTTVDVFKLAKEWGEWQESLYGDKCMVPDCDETATINMYVWGHHVGRCCDEHANYPPLRQMVEAMLATVNEFGPDADTLSIHFDNLREALVGSGRVGPSRGGPDG